MFANGFDVNEIDGRIFRDQFMEELMKPVAQVAIMRLDSMHGLGEAARMNAVNRIFRTARYRRGPLWQKKHSLPNAPIRTTHYPTQRPWPCLPERP